MSGFDFFSGECLVYLFECFVLGVGLPAVDGAGIDF